MSTYAVTVLGHDRPGIIAEVTARLAGLGLNLEDSSMTLLRGHFAMTLVCADPAEPADPGADQDSRSRIATALEPLAADGSLSVSVLPVPADDAGAAPGRPFVLTVHGGDRPGIVSALAAELARAGGNVTDLSTRLAGGLYVLVAEVDLPAEADAALVEEAVRRAATDLGVTATLRPADADQL